MDYGFIHDGRVFTPNGTPDVPAAKNDARNRAIETAELAHWQTRPDRMVAYYTFPAEDTPLFGRLRVYRESFRPCLQTYVNQATPADAGTAKHATVTTWLGTVIGRIVSARVYRHNFGGRFVSLRMVGTNGAEYTGRASWDNGTVVRLRKVGG